MKICGDPRPDRCRPATSPARARRGRVKASRGSAGSGHRLTQLDPRLVLVHRYLKLVLETTLQSTSGPRRRSPVWSDIVRNALASTASRWRREHDARHQVQVTKFKFKFKLTFDADSAPWKLFPDCSSRPQLYTRKPGIVSHSSRRSSRIPRYFQCSRRRTPGPSLLDLPAPRRSGRRGTSCTSNSCRPGTRRRACLFVSLLV